MDKQAYEKSVGFVLDKKAAGEFSWDNVWGGIKKHFTDNKEHYTKALMYGAPLTILGGLMGGRKGVGLGLLAGATAGLDSRYKWSQQLMDMFGSKKQTTGGTGNTTGDGNTNNTDNTTTATTPTPNPSSGMGRDREQIVDEYWEDLFPKTRRVS